MKKNTAIIKKLVAVAIILVVVTISVIAFIGIYVKDLNKMSNLIPDYTYSTEFLGNREYKFVLDTTEEEKEVYIDSEGNICGEVISDTEETTPESTEVEVTTDAANATVENVDETNIEGYTKEKRIIKSNEEFSLTKESYKKTRAIIEDRLEKIGVAEYNTRLNEVTGELTVELPDDEDANFIYEAISSKGEFEISDSQTGLKLMDNSHLKNATFGFEVSESGNSYAAYLYINFNKDGSEILKSISNEYVKKLKEITNEATDESTEATPVEDSGKVENSEEVENTASETEIKTIDVKLDGTILKKVYFDKENATGMIRIPVSENIVDDESAEAAKKSTNAIAIILNSGNMPNAYTLESDDFLQSSIKTKVFDYIKLAFIISLVIISIIFVIRFGLKGLIGAILNIGYLATVSLAIRYTGVIVTISCLITVIGVIALNLGFMYILLRTMKNGTKAKYAYTESMKKFYLSIMPTAIVAFIFTFMQNASVIGIGMILFWGLIVQALYSVIFTRNVYVLNEK